MGLGGPVAAFGVAGLLFALSLPLLLTVRIRSLPSPDAERAEPGTARQDLLDGLRYIRRHRLVGPLVVSGAVCELGLLGPLNVGMVLLNAERGWGPSGYGWIVSSFGVGAAASAAVLAIVGWLPRAGLMLGGTLLVGCAGAATIALVPTLWVAVVLAAVIGLNAGVFGSLNNTLIQTAADPAYLGRVTSVVMLTMVGLAPLSYPLVGAAIGAWGAGPVFVGCGAFAGLGAVIVFAASAVRRAELPRGGRA
jgi:MFS family permease